MAKQSEATLLLKIKTMGQEALDSLSESFDTIKNAALIAFGAISAVVVKSVMDYREQEEATNSLTQAMVNNGIYSKALKDDYLAQAAAIQKLTLFGDEQVIAAQAALQMQIGEQKVTKELTLAVADLAQAKKMDLVSAAELVGKTLGSTNNLLARQGVEFDNSARGAERLSAVTAALNKEFGGQAQAATTGLGAIRQMNNALSDVAETFGEKLTPYLSLAAQAMKEFAEDTKNSSPLMDGFIYVMRLAAELALDLLMPIKTLGAEIGIGLATAVEAASMALKGEFKEALSIAEQGLLEIGEAQARIERETREQIQAIRDASTNAEAARLRKEENNLKTSLANKAADRQQATDDELAKELENNQKRLDLQAAYDELRAAQKSGSDTKELDARIALQNAILSSNASHEMKLAAQQELYRLKKIKRDEEVRKLEEQNLKSSLGIITSLSQSGNDQLAAIGKAAAITQIAIDTPKAIGNAIASGIPFPGNMVAAGLVGAAMAQQAARAAGVQLAEGGIVKARPGGIQATIGEGGRDEAVIPLENGQIPGSQGNVTINFSGPVMGDERQAHEFAVMIDKKLLELRRNGDSVAFERIT